MGQEKGENSCLTYMLSGIALGCGPLADVPVIRARVVSPLGRGHSVLLDSLGDRDYIPSSSRRSSFCG